MTPDELLDAMLARVKAGDPEAAAFFPVFRDWYLSALCEPVAATATVQ